MHVIAYASCMLDRAQCNYHTTEKELFVVVFALEKFKSYLFGTNVIVFTYHAALRYLLKKKRSLNQGVENYVVDHLSRLRTKDIQTETIRETFLDK